MKFSPTVLASLVWLYSSSASAVVAEERDLFLSRKLAHQFVHDRSGLVASLSAASSSSVNQQEKQQEPSLLRRLQSDDKPQACDAALAECMKNVDCLSCFAELKQSEVDWASVSSDLSCQEALKPMYNKGHCAVLKNEAASAEAFCHTYTACIGSQTPDEKKDKNNDASVDCSKLTTCDFPGIHKQFLGDGICNDELPGCYNTAICGFDGGDCCKDTCEGGICGLEGFACRDPQSNECDSKLTYDCETDNSDDGEPDVPTCESGEDLYRLNMYDSFGDGWEETNLSIENDKKVKIFDGALEQGSMGMVYICLKPGCYHATAKGGIWGKEVSWEVQPNKDGAPILASGGSPMDCDFAVAGTSCETTCNGRTDVDPTTDPDYKEYKDLRKCINGKCPIQKQACKDNEACKECYEAKDLTPGYCFGIDEFNDLVDCGLCGCTDEGKMEFCLERDSDMGPNHPCSPHETLQGSNAILEFSQCTNFDEIAMLMIEFDNSHFGDLDTFEACAHDYKKDSTTHGGHTAMGCLRILFNAMESMSQVTKLDPVMTEAVAALSTLLYEHGPDFCDCAEQANKDSPVCPSFHNFKTLLYESIDACNSLDEIDCAAWAEFEEPCRKEMVTKFSSIDFSKKEQCDYVHDGCGVSQPFPVFRRIDCDVNHEVTEEGWDFYKSFESKCLGQGPAPTPSGPTPSGPAPGPTPSGPTPSSPTDKKPYVPPEDRGKDDKKKDDKKDDTPPADDNDTPDPTGNSTDTNDSPAKGSSGSSGKSSGFMHKLFWFCVLVGGGYWYYKVWGTSPEGIKKFCIMFARLLVSLYGRIRARFTGGSAGGTYGYDSTGNDAMYSGLAMESSTTFEPAHLPPPPSAMGGGPPQQGNANGNYYI